MRAVFSGDHLTQNMGEVLYWNSRVTAQEDLTHSIVQELVLDLQMRKVMSFIVPSILPLVHCHPPPPPPILRTAALGVSTIPGYFVCHLADLKSVLCFKR